MENIRQSAEDRVVVVLIVVAIPIVLPVVVFVVIIVIVRLDVDGRPLLPLFLLALI
jgi:hypothetical protein